MGEQIKVREPIVDMVGDVPIHHGERGDDLDSVDPEACLCGRDIYWRCPHWLNGVDTVGSLTVAAAALKGEDQ